MYAWIQHQVPLDVELEWSPDHLLDVSTPDSARDVLAVQLFDHRAHARHIVVGLSQISPLFARL
jgi:hypothetical protein